MPRLLLARFSQHGYEVATVEQLGLATADDVTVVTRASETEHILVTLDRGLGNIRAYPPGSHAGIIVLHPRTDAYPVVDLLVEAMLAQYDLSDWRTLVVIVEPGRVRVRRPG